MSGQPLTGRAGAALVAAGLTVTPGTQAGSFRVDGDGVEIVVVALTSADTIACYAVWPEDLPLTSMSAVAEVVVLANTTLHSSALELGLGAQGLSGRSALASCSRIQDDALLAVLLGDVVAEARRALSVHAPVVEAVLAGTPLAEAFTLRLPDL